MGCTAELFFEAVIIPLYPKGDYGSGGIRTHASEETGALNQRLRPLGHATLLGMQRASQTLATLFWQRMLSVQVLQRTGQLPTLGDISPIISKQAIHHVMDAE